MRLCTSECVSEGGRTVASRVEGVGLGDDRIRLGSKRGAEEPLHRQQTGQVQRGNQSAGCLCADRSVEWGHGGLGGVGVGAVGGEDRGSIYYSLTAQQDRCGGGANRTGLRVGVPMSACRRGGGGGGEREREDPGHKGAPFSPHWSRRGPCVAPRNLHGYTRGGGRGETAALRVEGVGLGCESA